MAGIGFELDTGIERASEMGEVNLGILKWNVKRNGLGGQFHRGSFRFTQQADRVDHSCRTDWNAVAI
jgi:hypothetical protein